MADGTIQWSLSNVGWYRGPTFSHLAAPAWNMLWNPHLVIRMCKSSRGAAEGSGPKVSFREGSLIIYLLETHLFKTHYMLYIDVWSYPWPPQCISCKISACIYFSLHTLNLFAALILSPELQSLNFKLLLKYCFTWILPFCLSRLVVYHRLTLCLLSSMSTLAAAATWFPSRTNQP